MNACECLGGLSANQFLRAPQGLREPHVFGRFKAAGKGSSAAEQRAAAVAYAAPRRHAISSCID